MRTRSKRRYGGGIDPPTMSMTIPQIKSYITTYRQEMMSAKEQKMKKADLFAIAMETYHAFRAVENKMTANLQAALKRAPGNHVTNRRTKQSPRRSPQRTKKNARNALLHLLNAPSSPTSSKHAMAGSTKKNKRNALLHLLNAPSSPTASAAAAASFDEINNLSNRFSRMSLHHQK